MMATEVTDLSIGDKEQLKRNSKSPMRIGPSVKSLIRNYMAGIKRKILTFKAKTCNSQRLLTVPSMKDCSSGYQRQNL
jgi:hypothetical protein